MTVLISGHWMNRVTKNVTESLIFARALSDLPFEECGNINEIYSLVKLLNATAIELRNCCRSKEFHINNPDPIKATK